ncbi:MAG: trehalose-phosphatase [Candidatus Omnitrophota bacterium]
MEYLFSHLEKLKNRLNGKFILLFLDYDGTLTPIVETPEKAVISREAKDLLKRLSKKSHCSVAIISGRSLSDIKGLIGLKDIIYAGNHGLEIEGPKIKFESQVSPRLKSIIRHIYEDAVSKFSKIKGVLIEDKGLTISVHYRLVDEKDVQEFVSIFNEIINPYIVRSKIRIDSGKKVYEIKPPLMWDKGKAVLWLLARQQFALGEKRIFPVYIGDDVTDEDAFKALKRKGLTVFVEETGRSKADYYLKGMEEVTRFLRLILGLKYN